MLSQPSFLFGGTRGSPQRAGGVLLGLAAAMLTSGAFMSIKAIGDSEDSVVVAMWFHIAALAEAAAPLALGVPKAAVVPGRNDMMLLAGVSVTSCLGELLISRSCQLLAPSLAAALNLTQVLAARKLCMCLIRRVGLTAKATLL